MAHQRLTREEREFLKRRVSEERLRRAKPSRAGLSTAEVAYSAADGDGLYALWLAVDAYARVHRGEAALKNSNNLKASRRKALSRRISFEELMQA